MAVQVLPALLTHRAIEEEVDNAFHFAAKHRGLPET
jgi:hypothetical protein